MKAHWSFLIYTILYEILVLGGTGYAVFVLGHSGWWFILGCLLSAGQITPKGWRQLFDKSPHENSN